MTRFAWALLLLALCASLDARQPARSVRNAHEIYRELAIEPGSAARVSAFFPSFLEYQDAVMFHPTFGYYASGRVDFIDDYQTFPIVLAPVFGQMLAEQIFRMWDGMRQAGSLAQGETFTIGEVGAGNGALAESILDYLDLKARSDHRWATFAGQTIYVCYDRSPALSAAQKARNARFGARFEARLADATDLTASITANSLKGVVLSNELPDAFSVHKVVLTTTDAPAVAYVAPSVPAAAWQLVRALLPPATVGEIEAADGTIERTFLRGDASPTIYLSRATFTALLEAMAARREYASLATALQFHEIYVPVAHIPELAAHLRRYASVYAEVLARDNTGIVTYVNLGVEKMLHGAASVLAAGYVITIDYGSGWNGILANDASRHLRTYGPAHRAASAQANVNESASVDNVQTSDPYDSPTLTDLTTDVNFSLMDVEGREAGLRTLFYGSQKALQSGTSISLDNIPEPVRRDNRVEKFVSWAADFRVPGVYKVIVQQKQGTDARYRFPDGDPEPLELSSTPLTSAQRDLLDAIVKRLTAK